MEGLILSFIYYNIIVYIIYKHHKRGEYEISNKQLFFFTLLFIGFGTYGNHLGDYWRINEMVEFFGKTPALDIDQAMEANYYLLAKFVNGNYVLWRLIICTTCFTGFAILIRKAQMANYPTLMLFATMCLFWAAGHRGYWGYIYYYFGLFLFFRKKKPIFLLVAAFSYFSHSSNILLLVLLPIAFFKISRFRVIALIIVLGFGLNKFQKLFNDAAENGVGNDYYSHKIGEYASQNANNFFGSSIGEYCIGFFDLIPKYFFMFYMLKLIFVDKTYLIRLCSEQSAITTISVVLFIVSVFAFFMDLGSGTIAYRILTMSTFPILILSQNVLVGNLKKYRYKMAIMFFISIELTYFFSIYYASIHGINPN